MRPYEQMRPAPTPSAADYADTLVVRVRAGGTRPVDRMLRALLDGGARRNDPTPPVQAARASDSVNEHSGSV